MYSMRPALLFSYDPLRHSVSAKCKICGEQMPEPSVELSSSGDLVVWLSRQFIEHKKLKHAPQTQEDERLA